MNKKQFTLSEVDNHKTPRSAWVILNEKVYDVTKFLFDHPGGEELILQHAGKDISEIMKDQFLHTHSESAYDILEQYYIGDLVTDEKISVENLDTLEAKKQQQFIDITKPMLSQVWNGGFSKEFYMKQVHIPRHSRESAPIFGGVLEVLTKTPWYVIPIVWLPVSIGSAYYASFSLPIWQVLCLYVIGFINWTFLEYVIHRFLFHVDDILPDHSIALTLHFLIHGIHHFLPMDKMRLVMPPALAVILSYPIWSFYLLILPFDVGMAFAGGVYLGYISYDLTHYYLHHGKPFGHLKEMKTYHLDHHYKEPNLGFGITSKIWDRVFNTLLV